MKADIQELLSRAYPWILNPDVFCVQRKQKNLTCCSNIFGQGGILNIKIVIVILISLVGYLIREVPFPNTGMAFANGGVTLSRAVL